jgi:branched-chain amino acid transport system substrate-binding protein
MKDSLICVALASVFLVSGRAALADVKVGLMLPYSGVYAQLGQAIENGFKLYVKEQDGKLGGQRIVYVAVDDQSDQSKALDNAQRLIQREKVDILVGSVHSGVTLALTKAARDADTTLIIPSAGSDAITGPLCSKLVFRTSSSNWQPAYAAGPLAASEGYKTAVTVSWDYTAGKESADAFKAGFEANGGKVLKQLALPFPSMEFRPLLDEIMTLKPDMVYAFFAGSGAVKFVKDYAAPPVSKTIPLMGPGFLTEGVLHAQGEAAEGVLTTLHYADGLDTARDNAFRASYTKNYPAMAPDAYAVQGYDAAQLLQIGLKAVNGDVLKKDEMRQAMSGAKIDSPRGAFALSKAGNPIEDFYVREVGEEKNLARGIAQMALEDPARGCALMR